MDNLGEFWRVVGGLAKTPAKARAARINGQLGGRPTGPGKKKRTLLEFLLRKNLTGEQHRYAQGALDKLNWDRGALSEAERFRKQFFVEKWNGIGYRIDLATTAYRVDRPMSSTMKSILRKFRRAARASVRRASVQK
jgi:hypothetical protein